MAISDSQANGVIKYKEGTTTVKVEEAVKLGDAIGWSSGWVRALATVATAIQQRYIACEDGAAEQEIEVAVEVVLAGERLSGGTRGAALYVAEGTDYGEYTETAPTTTGDCDKIVGYMLSATRAYLNPGVVDDSTA